MPDLKAYLLVNDQKISLKYEETMIGRLSTNLIPINDPTISKSHAAINFISSEDKFYLRDLGTVNGTYLNGNRLEPNKRQVLKHKDSIQFGKHANLYGFFMSQPQSQLKGKINLKDYCFQFESDEEENREEPMRPPSNLGKSNGLSNKNKSNIPKEGKKFKIPNLADYLELSGSLLSEDNSNQIQINQNKIAISKFSREGKVALPKMANQFDEADLQRVRRQQQNRRNIFLAKQAEKQARQQKARALEQSKIRLQIEKQKHQQEMLRKRLELQSKVREEQQRMESQRRKIQQELLHKENQRRQRERQAEEQQRQKQRKFIQRLQQQKEEELRKIKNEEELLRTRNETAMREELQNKKRDLQMEAQALAQQYEQIYRETIKKMKNDIQKQENEIDQSEHNIESLKQENISLHNKHNQVIQAVAYAKKQFNQISGRNKAFILYASQLQDRLDRLKGQKAEEKQKRVNIRLKQEILNSRKLLYMKQNQIKTLEDEIGKLKLSLSFGNKMGQGDMLETIVQNHQAIQNCKYIYFQYLRQEKALKQLWEQQLEQNQHLQQQYFTLQKEVQNGKKQLFSNIKDNVSRLTQQRVHMLKCLHYLPQEKKKAAKYLIEEMVTMEEEIRGMIAQSEQSHDKIHELILDSQRKKQENEYLSQLLFGADTTAHHFDNMKVQINTLIQRLEIQRDDSRAMKRLKITQEIQNNQVMIHEQGLKLQRLRNRWREGLQGQKIVLAEKNPIVFFGDLLAKRENDLYDIDFRISKLEREHIQVMAEVEELQRKKQTLNDSLQRFKRDQLQKVRQSLL